MAPNFHTQRQRRGRIERKEKKVNFLIAAHLEEQAAARAAQQPGQAPTALLLLLLPGRRHLPGRRGSVRGRRLHRVLAVSLRGHPRHPGLLPSVALRRDIVRRRTLGVFRVVASGVVRGGAGGRVACFGFGFVFLESFERSSRSRLEEEKEKVLSRCAPPLKTLVFTRAFSMFSLSIFSQTDQAGAATSRRAKKLEKKAREGAAEGGNGTWKRVERFESELETTKLF